MEKRIDKNILKYIPREFHSHLIYAGRFKDYYANYYCYEIMLDENYNDEHGEPTSFMAHNVNELKWAFKKIQEGWRGEIF